MTRTTPTTTAVPAAGITLRRLNGGDDEALARLAQRDTRRVPIEPLVGAELDGRLVAAISIATDEVVADPFRPTAAIVDMLRVRAGELDSQPPAPRRRWLRTLLRPRRGRASLASSPPGAGGRMLTLARR
ncbi:MAG: hypothetical protein ACRDL3_04280 [Solirubrobacterales bacterium]